MEIMSVVPILISLLISSPPGHKIYKQPRIDFFKKINKPVLSQVTFYLEVDDHKPVGYNDETIGFTYEVVKI